MTPTRGGASPTGDSALRRRLAELLRPGDRLVWSPAAAEPTPLLRAVLDAAEPGSVELLSTLPLTDTVDAEVEQAFPTYRLGGLGTSRRLRGARVLPLHWSALPRLFANGDLPVDVALVQVAPADETGLHSLGVDASFSWSALRAARVRIAEVNSRMPRTEGHERLPASMFDLVLRTDRPLPEVPEGELTGVDRAIGRQAAAFVDDRAVLQVGIGRTTAAVLDELADRRDLGVHTGLLGPALWRLIGSGAVTNAHKTVDRGRSVAGTVAGHHAMYDALADHDVIVRDAEHTHGARQLASLDRFHAINTAVEVDLTGQVNAEWAGGRFVGGVGGLADFVRGAALSAGGRAIIALRSTTATGRSTIVQDLQGGAVTVPRSDVDVVVTEWGAAQLRGCDLQERARRLAAVAAPQFREALLSRGRVGSAPVPP